MKRRSFVKACGAGVSCAALAASLPHALSEAAATLRRYPRVQLMNDNGQPLKASALSAGKQWVFAYPFKATPAFLINLNTPVEPVDGLITEAGEPYQWPGGVGPGQTVVAYSAICAHKLAHPTPSLSYISYRPARDGENHSAGLITCCAENSRYDPARGAAVINGPARQPLATILLEHNPEDDSLFAIGTVGGEVFNRFFDEFSPRLQLEYPNGDAMTLADTQAVATPLEAYCDNVMGC
ncbi:Rieske 2Fe-2S domain-containing protein [Spiribacter sp. C176]|uniref:Rieske 2Fe-2S domain-containing protein n=1 Tax=Spiribacter salilacus TaxID=2664894 RepID=A0A6N7QRI6_9GAMM|nr:twin-arginine translocation signal domain-containing protein [Spiribacter salilacus]MRH78200.1 Rieske 2Fe-2S domain-containing protein [Spiribacter salilacus]